MTGLPVIREQHAAFYPFYVYYDEIMSGLCLRLCVHCTCILSILHSVLENLYSANKVE